MRKFKDYWKQSSIPIMGVLVTQTKEDAYKGRTDTELSPEPKLQMKKTHTRRN